MAKMILGIDIGTDSLKLVLMSKHQVKKCVIVPIPNALVRDYRVVSVESMGELIRKTMKENGIRCHDAAVTFPNETVFVRTVVMPQMSVDQLTYNLPFEFRDYITDELKDYVYDYAMLSTPEQMQQQTPSEEEEEQERSSATMELLACAAPLSLVNEARELLRKAGLRMVRAAPTISAYIALIRLLEKRGQGFGEYCILDLGYQAIRMYMFQGERHIVTRNLEMGLSTLDNVLSDEFNVDVHLAHTYLLSNFEGCQERECCISAYGNIAVELMRALNFYRFSNPDSQINHIWLCGGGAVIAPLRQAIADTLDLEIHKAAELVPGGEKLENCFELVQAIGITMD